MADRRSQIHHFASRQAENHPRGLPATFGEILLHWEAPEHEPLELGPRSRIAVTFALIAVVAYALFTNSPLMAITFILIGVIGYLALHHQPRIVDCYVTTKGIACGKDFYEFESIHSFWIYTEPPLENILSLQTSGTLVPFAHVPVLSIDQAHLRETLLDFVVEEKHHPGLVDTLERLLHI